MDESNSMRDADFRSAPSGATSQGEKEDWIGRQLRRVFDSALSEPLPDDIMSLLDRLDDAPSSKAAESSQAPEEVSSEDSKGAA